MENNCLVLQDEKSLPPEDFRQVEKAPQLPREFAALPSSQTGELFCNFQQLLK